LEHWKYELKRKEEKKINILEEEKVKIENNLKAQIDKSERYSSFWSLKEIHSKLKRKYDLLTQLVSLEYHENFILNLKMEIYYFEICLKMLKEKFSPDYIDFQHYLNGANLEFEFFLTSNQEMPSYYLDFEINGYFEDPRLNLIFNNIVNAQKFLKRLVQKITKEYDLFLYYEVIGDLFIHRYCLFNVGKSDFDIEKEKQIICALKYYKKAQYYKTIIDSRDPKTYHDGLHGWPCLKIFVDFYQDIGSQNVHNLTMKTDFLLDKFKNLKNEICEE